MPYITPRERRVLDPAIDDLIDILSTEGQVNYVITRLLEAAWSSNQSYEQLNKTIGVLECVKLEFYRQFAVPYEDKKKEENGPV